MAEARVSLVLDKLTALISDEVAVFLGATKELRNLKGKQEDIRSTLRVADGVPYFMVEGVRPWLQKLKDVSYDVEDIIDQYQANINKRKKKMNKMKKVFSPFTNFSSLFMKTICLRYKHGKDIRAINNKLAQIRSEKNQFDLGGFAPNQQRNRATCHFINEKDVVGREIDRKTLVEKLLGNANTSMGGGGCNVSIISIIGIGGIGKTTLAKMVFNDEQVKKCFGESMWWVSILQKPNAEEVVKKITEQAKKDAINISELNTLTELLHPKISKKKFLLVLDDVWDLDWWEEVESFLMKGAPGSKIIITTRKKHISNEIRATYMHELENFSDDKSWELFLKHVLSEGEVEEDLEKLKLRDIGIDIVGKCGGLPIVLRTVGKVIQSKQRTREAWELVANSKIWNWKAPSESSFISGLILSYDDLPILLKHYFLHFSLFPRGSIMPVEDFVMNLMAHGFVEDVDESDIEVMTKDHINDLIGRCLFQLVGQSERYPDGCLQMHDVIYVLATHIAGREYSHNFVYENTRHLTIDRHLKSLDEIGLKRNQVLRTLLCLEPLHENPLDKYICNLKMLRVLDLSDGHFTKLSDSIGELVLLKHLDLMRTKITELPASICKLQSLLSLFLDGSEIKKLSKEIGELRNLRHLSLNDTPQLEFIAEGLGELSCLRTLSRFILCCANRTKVGCNIKELKKLSNLCGKLTIENLERITRADDAKEAMLQEKQYIENLELIFENIMIPKSASIEQERRVAKFQERLLDQLRLPPNVKVLSLIGYCGKKLPQHWSDELVHLEELKLQNCSCIEILPSFPTIRILHLHACHHLKTTIIDGSPCLEKLVVDGCVMLQELPFSPKLLRVELNSLDNWDGWTTPIEKGPGECLKVLEIRKCSKLKSLPQFPALQRLEIGYCEELCALQEEEAESKLNNLPALIELQIQGCPSLHVLPPTPKLEKLKIGKCKKWEGWSLKKEKDLSLKLPCLREIEIRDCPRLTTLPFLPRLIRLAITY